MPDITLLLVDDDESDAMLFRRTCCKENLDLPLAVARDAAHALEILHGKDENCDVKPPVIVITDINMPGMTGIEFIRALRSDKKYADTVIYVWSTSELASDIEQAYAEKIAGYIVKDDDGHRLRAAVRMLKNLKDAIILPSMGAT